MSSAFQMRKRIIILQFREGFTYDAMHDIVTRYAGSLEQCCDFSFRLKPATNAQVVKLVPADC